MMIKSLPITAIAPVNSVDVGVAVLSRNLDMVKQLGESMIKMMEQSVTPHLGQNIDIKV